jgi:hypothetical protein
LTAFFARNEEVVMKSATAKLVSAVLVTVLDAVVAERCGPLLWGTWSSVPWARLGLLLLAGSIAFTLMDIWCKTLSAQAISSPEQIGDRGLIAIPSAGQGMEGADV